MRDLPIIVRNSARCLVCNTEIVSTHRHDFVRCQCGRLAVDGGTAYSRRLFAKDARWTDTSILAEREPDDMLEQDAIVALVDRVNAGLGPRPEDLAAAPILFQWQRRPSTSSRLRLPTSFLVGIVTGHDDFDDGAWIATGTVVLADKDEEWAMTVQRLYRLGDEHE